MRHEREDLCLVLRVLAQDAVRRRLGTIAGHGIRDQPCAVPIPIDGAGHVGQHLAPVVKDELVRDVAEREHERAVLVECLLDGQVRECLEQRVFVGGGE